MNILLVNQCLADIIVGKSLYGGGVFIVVSMHQ